MSEVTIDSTNKKRGLGRGLGSLLSNTAETPANIPQPKAPSTPSAPASSTHVATPEAAVAPALQSEGKVWQVGVDKILTGTYQPRTNFDKESLQELAQSIKEHGILQPITVRKNAKGQFEIIAGERRWRAAQLAGLHEVPVLIKNIEDRAALELAIIENVQREDLNPIETADAYSRLASEFNLSQQQIAEKVGKDRATVANAIRLLLLPKEVRELVAQGQVSVGHAKVLLSLPDGKRQVELARQILNDRMPVRKLEKIVSQIVAGTTDPTKNGGDEAPMMNSLVAALADELQKLYGTKVQIDYSQGKGKISISFYSNEELNNLVENLKAGRSK